MACSIAMIGEEYIFWFKHTKDNCWSANEAHIISCAGYPLKIVIPDLNTALHVPGQFNGIHDFFCNNNSTVFFYHALIPPFIPWSKLKQMASTLLIALLNNTRDYFNLNSFYGYACLERCALETSSRNSSINKVIRQREVSLLILSAVVVVMLPKY